MSEPEQKVRVWGMSTVPATEREDGLAVLVVLLEDLQDRVGACAGEACEDVNCVGQGQVLVVGHLWAH